MNSIKKIMSLVLVCTLICGLLAACGSSSSSGGASNGGSSNAAAETNAADGDSAGGDAAAASDIEWPTMTVQVGHVNGTNDTDQYNKFAVLVSEYISEATGGAITVEVHGNSELGGELDMLNSMKLGTVDMGVITNGFLGQVNGENMIIDLPYMFEDEQTVYDFLDSDIVTGITDRLYENLGYKVLGWGEGGFYNIMTHFELNTPDQMQNIKIRTMEQDNMLRTFGALGCQVTPMAFSECFTAAQQGVIDSMILPIASFYANSYHEIFEYYNVTKTLYNALALTVSQSWWEQFTPEQQAILQDAVVRAGRDQRVWLAEQTEQLYANCEAEGCTVNYDVDMEAFKKVIMDEGVWESFYDVVGEDLFNETRAWLDDYAANR